MKRNQRNEKQKTTEDRAEENQPGESPWLAEIRSALSPYWSARLGHQDKKAA